VETSIARLPLRKHSFAAMPDFIHLVSHYLLLASDATILALIAAALLALSGLALWGDVRRRRRRHIDAVGLMPWRDIAALACFAGLILLAMAVVGWLKG